ncbi:serine hydrolase [Cohnella sp. AR92]|uniref:serine hydrolase domain-containing protein n=1 Tax=Cohnella sp. AR92 TaxID=648716 RepID=UPI000F8E8385|nr:serine hydrolase domain-containing protein [Cohnella sp. AR92]RUS45138.1 class A beta-lactamase-related serine hydrolase [Cohnella sp. AR92]
MSEKDLLSERMTALLKRVVERGPAGVACKVVRRGKVLYDGGYGLADRESNRAIAPDTLYRIYSMTKVVTCVAALKLYEQGYFLLDDPLEEYLPAFANPQVAVIGEDGNETLRAAAGPIRIKHLFTMSSGITYGGAATDAERRTSEIWVKSAAESDARSFAQALADVPLAFDPGTRWRYGLSHDVLAAFVEAVSGQTYGQYLKKEILEPLGMNDTSFRITEENRHRMCTLYDYDAGKLTPNGSNPQMDAWYDPNSRMESGGIGLISTIGDYSRFAQALARGGELDGERIIGSRTLALMASNHLNEQQMRDFGGDSNGFGYGLGVQVMMKGAAGGNNGTVGHYGWPGLAGTYMLVDPAEELSIVYMQQMMPNLEQETHPRLRHVVYGALD